MKIKIWIFQIPIILFFAFGLYIHEKGTRGELHSEFLNDKVYMAVRSIAGWTSNIKFRFRGPQPPKNKIVIVEIDNDALATIGRWPWHRDVTSYLVQKTFDAGAKVVGLDITFSEPDQRVGEELAGFLKQKNLATEISQFETDLQLKTVIARHADHLVTGWVTEGSCQPGLSNPKDCPVSDNEVIAKFPQGFDKFAFSSFTAEKGFDTEKTPIMSTVDVLANLPMYNEAAKHSGYFSVWPDMDGYIRKTTLMVMANGRAYPSLPLEMARVGLDEELQVTMDDSSRVASLGFAKSRRNIPVSPLGVMEINFRGPSSSFQYVHAMEVMKDDDAITIQQGRTLASVSKKELLKDAYVLIGLSAVGVYDMRAFPFDSNTPGVEGHANILDNILSGDMLVQSSRGASSVLLFLLMTVGAVLFAYYSEKLESIPALLLFITVITGITFADLKLLFANNINWNTGLLYLELGAIFIFTFTAKYVMEEKNKKFIRGALAKYVSPAIVDSILKDPTKLSLGGEKRELTIMFSDIRSFTTFSEKMDAKQLAQFLNEYLGTMTDLVFENEGTLDKYIGDAVMAFWGAPLDQPKHAANACRAAIKMMERLATLKPGFKEKYDIDVNVGIGINSGQVNVGNMGSERIFEYTVIGDQVNLASRLEGLTKEYRCSILTTRFTMNDITAAGESLPAHRVLDFVKVKGKKKAVELIQVLDRPYAPEGLKIFEKARQHYLMKEWDLAISEFENAAKLLALPGESDGPSQMYIERCKEFRLNPPSADWDGSWEMHSK